jgi:alcohol dehydrogenase (cytochrome c)
VYWGVGNAEPYDPRTRESLDSLFTNSVLALRPKTGEIACYFQYTPNDVYDVDATDENVLADVQIGGQLRKVMIQANKNGFLYVLDRTNCKLIAAHPYVKVNWATEIDLKTGRPALTDVYKRFVAGEEVEIWPSRGTNATPISFNPSSGLIYANTWNIARIQKLAAPQPAIRGGTSTGVIARVPEVKSGDVVGHFAAINPLTGEKKWEMPLTDLPSAAGMLATGGGLVFTGKLTGEFIALDQDTGKTLWQFKTGSSVNSTAITYTHKGRQYVTIASGLGGIVATRYAAHAVPAGGSVWTFALMPE